MNGIDVKASEIQVLIYLITSSLLVKAITAALAPSTDPWQGLFLFQRQLIEKSQIRSSAIKNNLII